MAVINLRNVVALGVLEDGVYPSVYNGQTGEYIGTVDGEGAGVKTVPTLYMYYRKNGHLYLYRTKERIEIDLTNVTAYDNSALFKLTEKSDISSAKITEFESRNIDVGHYEYKVPWVKSTQQYLYILVPIVRSIHTITVQGIISNQIFTLTGIYVHEGKSWWIYRTNVKTNFDFNDAVNEILDVQVYVRELTAEDLNPVEQLTKLLFEHINNKFNPHEVTKEQVGLGNVDNTADIDKPVSRPQKEYIDALENRIKGWFKQLNVWINNHVTEVNKKFQDVWAAINKKLDKEDYENDKDNFNAHIRNYDNPHRVTAAQVGLPTAASDIEKLKQKAQELQGLLINKQDKTSEELVTDNKRIVDAINEIYGIVVEHNNHVRSNSINQIEVTSEIPTTFEDGTLWIRIPRNEEDYITIKIEAVPVDSTIRMINSKGKESAGIGSASLECLIQSRLHYIVEKENYITKDVYVDVGVEDTTINVVLTPKTKKTLTVNATPDNALIIFTDKPSNVVIAQGTGTLTYETYDPRDILIQVGASGYETYEERITLDENIIRDIILTALPVEQGTVSLTVVDSETKAKIAAYVYDKDTDGILGQVTKDTPLQLTGDVNTSRILRFVSSGYIEVEQLVTYAIPTAEVTVEMDKVPVQNGTIYATAVNTESTALDGVTFEYKLSTESSWKPLGNDESTTGKSEVVTAPVGTSVDFRASKTGYITNTGTGVITNSESSVTIVLEEVPPEPTTKEYYIYVGDSETHQPIQGDTTAYLWVTDNWVKQTLSGSVKGFNYTGKPGSTIKVKFESVGYDTLEQDVTLPTDGVEPIQIGLLMVKETPPEPTTKEYFVFAVTEKNAPVETVTAASVLVDDEWIPQDLRTVVASIGFNYTAIPGTVIKVKFVATGFITEEIDVTLQTESDESLIVPVILHFEDGIDYMQIEGDGTKHPIFKVGDVESN
nr:MAG TPA: structural protein [Crassvirales sp.]